MLANLLASPVSGPTTDHTVFITVSVTPVVKLGSSVVFGYRGFIS
jgi:hypothetical protein